MDKSYGVAGQAVETTAGPKPVDQLCFFDELEQSLSALIEKLGRDVNRLHDHGVFVPPASTDTPEPSGQMSKIRDLLYKAHNHADILQQQVSQLV